MCWNAKSKVGSLDNIDHRPGGGMSRIPTQKLNFKEKAKAKIDSFTHYQPTGGQSTVGSVKLNYKHQAKSKVGSLINLNHKPKGGEKKVYWMNTSMPPQFHVIETHSLSFYHCSHTDLSREAAL